MKLDIKLNDNIKELKLIEKLDNKVKISVDGRLYEVDAVMVENGVFSLLIDNKSYNVEIVERDSPKRLTVNTIFKSFDIDIIDAEEKYKSLRKGSDLEDNNIVSSPMPGTVVKILVSQGDIVEEGETVIIVSAMKMESEYKVKQKRIVKEICVAEGDNIISNQALIILE